MIQSASELRIVLENFCLCQIGKSSVTKSSALILKIILSTAQIDENCNRQRTAATAGTRTANFPGVSSIGLWP